MSNPQAAPYETLARLAERELELLASGRLNELDGVAAERAALLATLPATPPACPGRRSSARP